MTAQMQLAQPIYKLVQMIDGDLHATKYGPESDFIAAMEIRGYEFTRLFKQAGIRQQLQGQPEFRGLLGPMWDELDARGSAVIRYEDHGAYDALSA
jgi:hypothetical protein